MFKLKILLVSLLVFVMINEADAQKKSSKKDKVAIATVSRFRQPEVTALFLDATKAKLLGSQDSAIILYKKVLEKDPGNDATNFELSQIYAEKNDITTALPFAEKAASLDPSNTWYKIALVQLYQHANRGEDAIKILQGLLKDDPENVDYLSALADIYIDSKKFDKAIDVLNQIEKSTGFNEDVSMQRQKLYFQEGDNDKAAAETEKLASGDPENASKYYAIAAEMFMSAKMPDKALEYYRKIAMTDPANEYIHISLSDYYRKKGDTQRALEELKLGFANPGLDIDTKIRILLDYFNTPGLLANNKDDALQLAQALVRAHPDDMRSHSILADFYAQFNQYSDAEKEYQKVIDSDSSKYAVYEGLMQCEIGLSEYQKLVSTADKAISLFPMMPLPYLYKGTAEMQLKKYNEAIKSFNSGIKIVSGNPSLLSQFYGSLGDVYNELKQYELSYQNYDKALSLDDKNSYVLNNYAYYLSIRNIHLDKAADMAKRGMDLNPGNAANVDTYGWVLYKQKKYKDAYDYIMKANSLETKPDADVLEHMGDVLYKLDRKKEAGEYWQKALDAGSKSEDLKKKVKDQFLYE